MQQTEETLMHPFFQSGSWQGNTLEEPCAGTSPLDSKLRKVGIWKPPKTPVPPKAQDEMVRGAWSRCGSFSLHCRNLMNIQCFYAHSWTALPRPHSRPHFPLSLKIKKWSWLLKPREKKDMCGDRCLAVSPGFTCPDFCPLFPSAPHH